MYPEPDGQHFKAIIIHLFEDGSYKETTKPTYLSKSMQIKTKCAKESSSNVMLKWKETISPLSPQVSLQKMARLLEPSPRKRKDTPLPRWVMFYILQSAIWHLDEMEWGDMAICGSIRILDLYITSGSFHVEMEFLRDSNGVLCLKPNKSIMKMMDSDERHLGSQRPPWNGYYRCPWSRKAQVMAVTDRSTAMGSIFRRFDGIAARETMSRSSVVFRMRHPKGFSPFIGILRPPFVSESMDTISLFLPMSKWIGAHHSMAISTILPHTYTLGSFCGWLPLARYVYEETHHSHPPHVYCFLWKWYNGVLICVLLLHGGDHRILATFVMSLDPFIESHFRTTLSSRHGTVGTNVCVDG